jgi:4-hydroxy-tetrahydrodipicolinate synthase
LSEKKLGRSGAGIGISSGKGTVVFEGIYTALITPLKNGTVDLGALARLVDRQLEAGVQGLVVCATTGEGATLTPDERRLVIDSAIKRAQGRAKVIVGTSQIAAWAAIEAIGEAADLGADAVMVSCPAYVRPSQDGIAAHFKAIADQSSLPLVLYNVPSRTASDIKPETVARLASHDRIVAIKEATGSIQRVQQVIAAVGGAISVLSGDDPITVSLLVAGGHGVISTGANVVPGKWAELWSRWRAGDALGAAAIQAGLLGLHEALFMETNPAPVKAALYMLGLISPEIRLPLDWPSRPTLYRLAAEMESHGLQVQGGFQ